MQNKDQTEILLVETTQDNDLQFQQQFPSQNQQNYQGQNYPPQNVIMNPQPMYNVNQSLYEFRPEVPQNRGAPKSNNINFMEQQNLCNSSRKPIMLHCPYCHKYGLTQITHSMGCESVCSVVLLCVTTCVCCWIPCFNKDCQNVNHFCYNCRQKVGESRYRKDEKTEKEIRIGTRIGLIALELLLKK